MNKTYKIPVVWQVSDIYEVEANSLEEAIQKAQDGSLPSRGEYIEDSFEIDYEGIPFHNRNLKE